MSTEDDSSDAGRADLRWQGEMRGLRLTAPQKTRSVLLVDDFEDGLAMYEEYLTYRGFHVVVARNGEAAVSQAQLHRPDVILLDLRMPGMTGTDVMRLLRADPSFVNTPIIALTAHAFDDERRLALNAGFDAVIAKPCLPDALVAAVERMLGHPGEQIGGKAASYGDAS
jgi:CheY-like chemotaxis protein